MSLASSPLSPQRRRFLQDTARAAGGCAVDVFRITHRFDDHVAAPSDPVPARDARAARPI